MNALLATHGAQAVGFRPLLVIATAYTLSLTTYTLNHPLILDEAEGLCEEAVLVE